MWSPNLTGHREHNKWVNSAWPVDAWIWKANRQEAEMSADELVIAQTSNRLLVAVHSRHCHYQQILLCSAGALCSRTEQMKAIRNMVDVCLVPWICREDRKKHTDHSQTISSWVDYVFQPFCLLKLDLISSTHYNVVLVKNKSHNNNENNCKIKMYSH